MLPARAHALVYHDPIPGGVDGCAAAGWWVATQEHTIVIYNKFIQRVHDVPIRLSRGRLRHGSYKYLARAGGICRTSSCSGAKTLAIPNRNSHYWR